MSKPETIMIDDVKYIREDSIAAPVAIGEKRIIAADTEWVSVGYCIDNDDGSVTINKISADGEPLKGQRMTLNMIHMEQ